MHHLHAKFSGVHIPGSLFKIVGGGVGNNTNNDPSTIAVLGRGMQGCLDLLNMIQLQYRVTLKNYEIDLLI